MRKQLLQILIFVFVDVLGFSLILPLLPYYADTFGASATVIGFLLASNAVTQLLGAPMLGRLSDRYGRRPLLIVSLIGTLGSFLLLGFARSLWMVFLSRILDGLLGGDITLAQAYISDITDSKDRAKGLGLIGAAFGLGFILGPAMGGALSAGGNYSLPAFIAAAIAAVNLVGVLLWLPESLPAQNQMERRTSPETRFSLPLLWKALHLPCVGPLLNMQLFYRLAFTVFETIFSTYALYRFALTAQSTSYVLAYVGIVVVIVQGGAIGALTKRFSERRLTLAGIGLLLAALLGWAAAPSVGALLVVLVPLSLASGILNTVLNSQLSKAVPPEEVGGALGLSSALGSFARIISPVAGGFLLERLGTWAPGIAAAVIMAGLSLYAQRHLRTLPEVITPACQMPDGSV
ncbi:MAG: MFS transporter [Anaerolineae bacterium]|jgi:DHA1 family tetracycline resistance protein-like MFS transporter|nr:MFS transporter [Anaerolineae bacterium]